MVTVKNPDGTPRPKETVQLCNMMTFETMSASEFNQKTKIFCKNFTSDDSGVVNFMLPPVNPSCVQMNIQADAPNHPETYYSGKGYQTMTYQPTASQQLRPWFSNSNRYMKLVKPTGTISCNAKHTFTVLANGKDGENITVNYQVMTRDGIVSEGSNTYQYSEMKEILPEDDTYLGEPSDVKVEMARLPLPVEILDNMSPQAQLLVFTLFGDEIVADSIPLEVEKCLKNQVNLQFSSKQAKPGESVDLTLTASPFSVCGVSAIDEGSTILDHKSQLSVDKIYDIYRNYGNSRFAYMSGSCVPKQEPGPGSFTRRKRSPLVPPGKIYSDYQDAYDAFRNAKISIMSDLNIVTKPCSNYYRSRPVDTEDDYAEDDVESSESVEPRPGGSYNKHSRIMLKGAARPMMAMAMGRSMAMNDYEPSGGSGSSDEVIRTNFPPTWIWDLVIADEKGGAGMNVVVPDTITSWNAQATCLNSQVGLGVSPIVRLKAFQPFFVSNSLPSSAVRGEVIPVTVSVSNYMNKSCPVTIYHGSSEQYKLENGVPEANFCVKGGKTVTQKILIRSLVIGKLNITTRASSNPKSVICADDDDVMDITEKDAATNSLVIVPEGFPKEQTLSAFLCGSSDSDSYESILAITPSADCIPDTVRGEIRVSGDLMGPAVQNLGDLIRLPTGCGEQNMFKLMTDILVYRYLKNTGDVDENTERKVQDFIKTGYQRQLSYAHQDGSFSSFGGSDASGSVMLTSFVIRGLRLADQSNVTQVDKSVIHRAATWLNSQQDDDDGCYSYYGEVFNYAIRGSRGALTSYIVGAMLDGSPAGNDTSMQKALNCVASSNMSDPYHLALATYALCKGKHPRADESLQKLMRLIKTEGEFAFADTEYGSYALGIEITSYAILCNLMQEKPNMDTVLPMIRWLTRNMRSSGSFYTTQDTLVAITALEAFSKHLDHRSMNSKVTVTRGGSEAMTFQVDKSNKLLLQTADLTSNNDSYVMRVNGTGCPLVQFSQFCNVRAPSGFEKFQLNVSAFKGVEKDCKRAEITTCLSYKSQDRPSNMALLEMQIPTGYLVDKDSLQRLKYDPNLHYKRGDVEVNKLILYFKELRSKPRCFTIGLTQNFEVADMKPSNALLYDYYQTEHKVSQIFSIPEKCEQ